MKHEDVRDLFAHLKTLPAVQGKVRDHDVPFPFNIRRTLGGWKLLFLDGEPFKPDASKDRGVESRRLSRQRPRPLRGMPLAAQSARRHQVAASASPAGPPEGGDGWVPNITQHGLSAWSHEDIVKLLDTGENRDADTVGGEMGKVVSNTQAARRERHRCDGGLYQVAAAGRRPAPTCCEVVPFPEFARGWLDEFVQGHLAQADFVAAVCISFGVHPLPRRDRRAGRPDRCSSAAPSRSSRWC